MKNTIKKIVLFLLIFTFVTSVFIVPVLADNNIKIEAIKTARDEGYKKTATDLKYNTSKTAQEEIPIIRDTIIKLILSFLGVFFLILIIWGGYDWMTAGGNEETVAKAKKKIINATIGLIIVLAAYILASFIFNALSTNTNAVITTTTEETTEE